MLLYTKYQLLNASKVEEGSNIPLVGNAALAVGACIVRLQRGMEGTFSKAPGISARSPNCKQEFQSGLLVFCLHVASPSQDACA